MAHMHKRHINIETEHNRKLYKSRELHSRKTNKKCITKVNIWYIHDQILNKWFDCCGLCAVRGNKHVGLKRFLPQRGQFFRLVQILHCVFLCSMCSTWSRRSMSGKSWPGAGLSSVTTNSASISLRGNWACLIF